jgi:hypothetical protein
MSTIFVTNNSDKILKDGFCGQFWTFKIGETVELHEDAARHIFGYKVEDKEPFLARLGWIKTTNDLEDGLARLAMWEFSSEPQKKNHSLSPVVERVPLRAIKQTEGKVRSVA